MFRNLIKAIIPTPLFRAIEPIGHWAEAVLANIWYGFPARKLRIVGVTGTNGKTTTAVMIASVLEAAGYSVGLSSTALFKVGSRQYDNEVNMTVTNPWQLQKLLKQMVQAGCQFAVVEVTSHALAQHREWGLKYEAAVMTNLTRDHLDYHGSMERYVQAKLRLFSGHPQLSVTNKDDDYYSRFAGKRARMKLSYGLKDADVMAQNVKLADDGSKFALKHGDKATPVHLHLPGQYNVYNALAAAATGLGLGLSAEQVCQGLEAVQSVPGRTETIDEGQKFGVVVDYAHTPDALEKLWTMLKAANKGRLIAVFGATGDRDRGKRPVMGAIAAAIADVIILTDEESYSEDPVDIIRQIEPGLKGKTYEVEVDRRRAIAKAFAEAKTGDMVAITGMGHQKFKVVQGHKQPWDDRVVAREELAKLKGDK